VVPAVSPVIELVYIPVVPASVVLLAAVVGLADVLQHTPRAVTAAPPSAVTFPPDAAVVAAIEVAFVVVTVGRFASAVNETSLPYAVPTLLVA
jgi:hypothetical protein